MPRDCLRQRIITLKGEYILDEIYGLIHSYEISVSKKRFLISCNLFDSGLVASNAAQSMGVTYCQILHDIDSMIKPLGVCYDQAIKM